MCSLLRSAFDRELADLTEAVLLMGSRAREAVAASVRAYTAGDVELAAEVVAGDRVIDEARYQIEQRCYALLVKEQPVAGDMRAIVTGLTIAGELERIGDHGKRIARSCQRTGDQPRALPASMIQQMASISVSMLDRALQVIASRDLVAARAVCAEDDKVDALYKQTFNVTLTYMLESTGAIAPGTQLIQIAHELERVADRATNIAERVIYAVKGELVELNA